MSGTVNYVPRAVAFNAPQGRRLTSAAVRRAIPGLLAAGAQRDDQRSLIELGGHSSRSGTDAIDSHVHRAAYRGDANVVVGEVVALEG